MAFPVTNEHSDERIWSINHINIEAHRGPHNTLRFGIVQKPETNSFLNLKKIYRQRLSPNKVVYITILLTLPSQLW